MGRRSAIVDALLACALLAVSMSFVFTDLGDGLNRAVLSALVTAHVAPLALRRRAPVKVLAWMAATAVITVPLGAPVVLLGPGVLVALYTVWSQRTARTAGLALAGSVVVMSAVVVANGMDAETVATNAVAFGVASWLGDRSRRLVERADAERARGEEAARRAAAEERVRIARELHDVIAHSMSVIAVQAGTGRFVIDDSPELAKQALANIEGTSRGALEEMRRLLSVLRTEGDDVADLTPAPGLADVGSLVDDTAAVVPVDLCVTGKPRPLPPGVDQCAYRIIQEALTNVRKHASARRAAVTISYLPEMLDLEIVDDGRGVSATASVRDGHGIVGMRERASLYGGALEVGPQQGGGFRVHASLPLVGAS